MGNGLICLCYGFLGGKVVILGQLCGVWVGVSRLCVHMIAMRIVSGWL